MSADQPVVSDQIGNLEYNTTHTNAHIHTKSLYLQLCQIYIIEREIGNMKPSAIARRCYI